MVILVEPESRKFGPRDGRLCILNETCTKVKGVGVFGSNINDLEEIVLFFWGEGLEKLRREICDRVSKIVGTQL